MTSMTDTVQRAEGTYDMTRNFRKALFIAIILHIILLYGVIESKPERTYPSAAPERTPIVLSTLPPVHSPTPVVKKPPKTRSSRSVRSSVPTPAVLDKPPKILPESIAITPEELMPDMLDPWSVDWPELEPPNPGPYAVSDPGIVPPNCSYRVLPVYPDAVRRLGLQGYVILSVIIDADGHPNSIRVLRSFNSLCDTAAVNAVTKWRFDPATLNDIPVPVEMVLTISFVSDK